MNGHIHNDLLKKEQSANTGGKKKLIFCRCTAQIILNFMWAMPTGRHTIINLLFGFQGLAYAGPETGLREPRELCGEAKQTDFCFYLRTPP